MLPNKEQLEGFPPVLIASLTNYYEHGAKPGSFLYYVLSGDLYQSIKKAGAVNLWLLEPLVTYICNNLPVLCYGSPCSVDGWCGQSGLEGAVLVKISEAEREDIFYELVSQGRQRAADLFRNEPELRDLKALQGSLNTDDWLFIKITEILSRSAL